VINNPASRKFDAKKARNSRPDRSPEMREIIDATRSVSIGIRDRFDLYSQFLSLYLQFRVLFLDVTGSGH
jgi:hypothetical protein